jgi:spermidine synthase
MKTRLFFIPLLLFGSGMAALVYQTVWLREFRSIFGSSTPTAAAVLARAPALAFAAARR